MRHERVKIRRDDFTVHNKAVPPWEVPVLEFVFGEGIVEPLNEFEELRREYPDSSIEFERLEKRYGMVPGTDMPFVAQVYGQKTLGRKALERAIREAEAADKLAIENDSLLS